MLSDNKYGVQFTKDAIETNFVRIINQLWKLLPMKENNEDWEKQLNTVIIEIVGLHEIFISESPRFLQLLSKLEGMRKIELPFRDYRKAVFEAINIIQEIKNNEE